MSFRLVLATANQDKAQEILAILSDRGAVEILPRPLGVPEVEETGATLLENARLKARALVEATGLVALADDTGLSVDALGGAPGVHSARFAGAHASYADNLRKVLDELRGKTARSARFVTIALAAFPDGGELVAEGAVEGEIAEAPRGEGGFGYDPIFVPREGDGRTFSEMTSEEKNALSHRGRAFRELAEQLAEAGLLR
jgi:XTP/dITP diphosphohydrolase